LVDKQNPRKLDEKINATQSPHYLPVPALDSFDSDAYIFRFGLTV